eukprot:5959764-Lingulodinium_polyedra.AAC.1
MSADASRPFHQARASSTPGSMALNDAASRAALHPFPWTRGKDARRTRESLRASVRCLAPSHPHGR